MFPIELEELGSIVGLCLGDIEIPGSLFAFVGQIIVLLKFQDELDHVVNVGGPQDQS